MSKQSRIVPAILTDDPKALQTMLRQSEAFTDYVQIDIMDGKFVPSRSITYNDLSHPPAKLGWEAHLMVLEPEKYLPGFQSAGARKVIFHYEATSSPHEVIARIKKLGMEAGLAINPETPVSSIAHLLKELDSVLLLSVHPGFYGAKFLPEVLDKVTELRRLHPSIRIGMDGGIKEGNIAQIARSGVDDICVGSAIFRQPDPQKSYERLLDIAKNAK